MNLHALCVVKNEADVIEESVRWAAGFCDRVWVWDLGSSDGTYELLQRLTLRGVHVNQRAELSYSKTVRAELLATIRPELPVGSWLYVLDADEFLAADPRPLLQAATAKGAHLVRAWHCNFYPTPADLECIATLGLEAWEALPLFERLRHFRPEWMERRFVRLTEEFIWEGRDGRSKMRLQGGGKPRPFGRAALVRHYRYRGPTQVTKRYETRQAIRAGGYEGFRYDQAARFEAYVQSESTCRRWPDGDEVPGIRSSEVLRFQLGRVRSKLRKVFRRASAVPG